MAKTCSTKNCFEDREIGDSLFCPKCRANWKDGCNLKFGVEQQAPKENIDNFLKIFQDRFVKDEKEIEK